MVSQAKLSRSLVLPLSPLLDIAMSTRGGVIPRSHPHRGRPLGQYLCRYCGSIWRSVCATFDHVLVAVAGLGIAGYDTGGSKTSVILGTTWQIWVLRLEYVD
jgi:hypothetical protein